MVRDLFVFCCYTGLTYVDVINLTPDPGKHTYTSASNAHSKKI
jgi:hypothetical protein